MVETRHGRIRASRSPATGRRIPDCHGVVGVGDRQGWVAIRIDRAAAAYHDPAVGQYRQVRPNAVWREASGGCEYRSGSADIHDPYRAVSPKDQAAILGE